jgi:hypothetical protein
MSSRPTSCGPGTLHAGLCGSQVADAARHKPLGCDGPVVHCTINVSKTLMAVMEVDTAAGPKERRPSI